MQKYITLSLKLHLFFARIMKEHALFLEAGFTPKNKAFAQLAEQFKNEFENILSHTIELSQGAINPAIINSGEFVTEYTLDAEQKTEYFTDIQIDSELTKRELGFINNRQLSMNKDLSFMIKDLNNNALFSLNELIKFKKDILNSVNSCEMFTMNYPLLIEHIIREAELYYASIVALENGQDIEMGNSKEMELFWDRIMMEHALFIRGLLDPSEDNLIRTADDFAEQYKRLLQETINTSDMMISKVTNKTIEETIKYRNFKKAGTKGIIDCEIKSIIVPLLADHVLREANHFLRILSDQDRNKSEYS